MLSPEIEDLKPLSMIFVLHWEIMVALASVGPGGPEYVCHELRSTVYICQVECMLIFTWRTYYQKLPAEYRCHEACTIPGCQRFTTVARSSTVAILP